MKEIPLTQGAVAKVDDYDYEWLRRFRWHLQRSNKRISYARRYSNGKRIAMQNELLSPLPGFVVDHINHNGLDNRRANLRLCMQADNTRNSRPRRNSSSKYKGVSFDKKRKKWRARIVRRGVKYFLGYFHNQIEAAFAYDDKARGFNDAFMYLNFPKQIVRDAVRERLARMPGRVFSIQFLKRSNGELRTMKAIFVEGKGIKDVGMPYEPNQRRLIVVYDVGKEGYRAVPIDGILTLKIYGENYRVI
jgi:hypothetical protein